MHLSFGKLYQWSSHNFCHIITLRPLFHIQRLLETNYTLWVTEKGKYKSRRISSSVKWWDLPLLWLSDSQKLWEICITTEIVSNVIHRWKTKCSPGIKIERIMFLCGQRMKLLSLTLHSFMSAKERKKIC